MRLATIGGRLLAFREARGVWHVSIGGRWGWALSFEGACSDAMRGRL